MKVNLDEVGRPAWLMSVYVALAHGARMLSMLAVIKLVAIFVGPEGLAKVGFFLSLSSILAVFAGGGISNAVTKYVAEYQGSPVRLTRFLGCATLYGGVFSLMVLGLSFAFAPAVAQMAFGDTDLWWVVPVYGFSHVLAFIGVMTTSAANGMGRQDVSSFITMSASALAISVSFILISRLELTGAALAIALMIASVGLLSWFAIMRSGIFQVLQMRYCQATFSRLLRFSVMAVSSAMFFPLTEIIIRSEIIGAMGLETAGLWQGLIRLSGAYLGFFTVVLVATFMPLLSRTKSMKTCGELVCRQIIRIGGGFIVFAFIVYHTREYVILAVFSEAFLPITKVILWQLIGDFFRVCSYVIGFLLISKSTTRLYVFGEFIQFAIYLTITLLIVSNRGELELVAQGYAVSYLIFFIYSLAILFRLTRGRS